MVKFMQQLNEPVYRELKKSAKARNIGIQELLRSIVIPDYLSMEKQKAQIREQPKKEQ